MVLDAATVRNLELVEPLFAGERRDSTLIYVLDKTSTGMGGRLLRQRLLHPCCELRRLNRAWMRCEELAGKVIIRSDLRKTLESVLDLERLLAKITLGTAGPRELLALGKSIAKLPEIAKLDLPVGVSAIAARHSTRSTTFATKFSRAISDEPPVNIWPRAERYATDFDPDLDELRDISRNSRQYIAAIETRERAATNIHSLKIRFNNVFGYYIEISKANLHLAPGTLRTQTDPCERGAVHHA